MALKVDSNIIPSDATAKYNNQDVVKIVYNGDVIWSYEESDSEFFEQCDVFATLAWSGSSNPEMELDLDLYCFVFDGSGTTLMAVIYYGQKDLGTSNDLIRYDIDDRDGTNHEVMPDGTPYNERIGAKYEEFNNLFGTNVLYFVAHVNNTTFDQTDAMFYFRSSVGGGDTAFQSSMPSSFPVYDTALVAKIIGNGNNINSEQKNDGGTWEQVMALIGATGFVPADK